MSKKPSAKHKSVPAEVKEDPNEDTTLPTEALDADTPTTIDLKRVTACRREAKARASSPKALNEAFGARFREVFRRRGWSEQADLAREASKYAGGRSVGRDVINYCYHGQFIPRARYLYAICRALKVDVTMLLPVDGPDALASAIAPDGDQASGIVYRDMCDGTAWVTMNQRVPQAVAFKILAILKDLDTPKK